MRTNVRAALVLCVLCVTEAVSASVATYYADSGWGDNSYDGTTSAPVLGTNHGPKLNMTAAIAAAANGDSIAVAAGFYQETNWDAGAKSLTLLPQGTVTVYATDPWTTDSDGDGMPDAWEVKYGLDAPSTNGVNGATGDADSDGVTNFEEYQQDTVPTNPDTTPLTLTHSPTANNHGWFNTDVTIQFTATDSGSGIASVTGDQTVQGETNNVEIAGGGRDVAGNMIVDFVAVNIDKTPPTITLDPGPGQTHDQSYGLLLVEFNDPFGPGSTATPSGLNPDALTVTLNGVDVTASFYKLPNVAVSIATNLSAGTYTWSARVSDYADNSVTSTVSFYSTGQSNANAPVISDLNLTDSGTLMPDIGQIWVQGNVSGDGSTVYASVNGGEAIAMNQREGVFGSLLPLETGTNVIVIMAADDAGANVSSRILLVERSDKFRASVSSPVFGSFVNGATLTAGGIVSGKYAAGTDEKNGSEQRHDQWCVCNLGRGGCRWQPGLIDNRSNQLGQWWPEF